MNIKDLEIKNAIVSVSDKEGLVELCTILVRNNVNLFASDGTSKYLEQNKISCNKISDLIHFPEILDGRVKTLHPAIHGGLLAKKDNANHLKSVEKNNIKLFDLLVVNFYPFEKVLNDKNSTEELIIENIDIGGPSMVRSASKNFASIAVLTAPSQYKNFAEELLKNQMQCSYQTRKQLAANAFRYVAHYDNVISSYFNNSFSISLKKELDLRYGENPHQAATLYGNFFDYFDVKHGKTLSYNNILDITASIELLEDLPELSCVIVKHNNPCGVAIGNNMEEGYTKALSCDPKSAFGGIVAFKNKIDENIIKLLNEIFLEVVIVPDLDDDLLEKLKVKKDRRIIIYKNKINKDEKYLRNVAGGILVQDRDNILYEENNLEVVTDIKPTSEQMDDLKFAWTVAKHVKSNSIVFVKNKMTIGIGAGQMSRIDAFKIAGMKAKEFSHSTKGCVIASDAFFPFADNIDCAKENEASCIIQPGGSVRDAEVIEAANKNNISMVFTKIRHFKH